MNPGCTLEGMMLKLKLQYFSHLMQRVDSLEKTLMLGGIGCRRRRGRQRIRWLEGIMDSMDVSLSELRELEMDREAWRAVIHGVTKSQTRLSDWTELYCYYNTWRGKYQQCFVHNKFFPESFVIKQCSGFSGGSKVKNPNANAGDMDSISDPRGSHMPLSNYRICALDLRNHYYWSLCV